MLKSTSHSVLSQDQQEDQQQEQFIKTSNYNYYYSDSKTHSARVNRAIISSNINLLKKLLANNPRNQDPVTRKTSIIIAAENDNVEICKLLIQEYQIDHQAISRDQQNNTSSSVQLTSTNPN
ncbi:hypothetical protein VP01_2811g1 [Puccinia sorghi]|uniref:Ankyrin repeat protein n=1 Tax=Puccinia sorghi TaxID=27349 RepID=A0A0L6V2F2_9BASI|nr:hypothetical protein VP01_2811g1 [Puccinia sorghi]